MSEHPWSIRNYHIPRHITGYAEENELLRQAYPVIFGYHKEAGHHKMVRKKGSGESIAIYCIDGRGWIKYGTEYREITKGDLLLIPSRCPHSYGSDPQKPWNILWLHAKGENTEQYMFMTGEKMPKADSHRKLPHPVIVQVGVSNRIIGLFHSMFAFIRRPIGYLEILQLSNILRQILAEWLALSLSGASSSANDLVETVYTFFEANILKSVTLDDAAAACGRSKYHIIKTFGKRTGMAPIECFINLKMQYAGRMLDTTDMTVGELADHMGYQDAYYFSRLFKKNTGYSPSRYRKMLNTGRGGLD